MCQHNYQIVLVTAAIFVIYLIYLKNTQDFSVYTSGATQRYATEFTSTNQRAGSAEQAAFGPLNVAAQREPFMSHRPKLNL